MLDSKEISNNGMPVLVLVVGLLLQKLIVNSQVLVINHQSKKTVLSSMKNVTTKV